MKKTFLLLTLLCFSMCFGQQNVSTFYFIRHAEKVDDSKNPDLSEIGLKRAQQWKSILSEIHFDEIYSTDFKRTMQTATPIATEQNLVIKSYDSKTLSVESFKNENLNKKVLMVGHSNSIPKFINQLILYNLFPDIPDDVFGNLYVITITGETISYQLLKLP